MVVFCYPLNYMQNCYTLLTSIPPCQKYAPMTIDIVLFVETNVTSPLKCFDVMLFEMALCCIASFQKQVIVILQMVGQVLHHL